MSISVQNLVGDTEGAVTYTLTETDPGVEWTLEREALPPSVLTNVKSKFPTEDDALTFLYNQNILNNNRLNRAQETVDAHTREKNAMEALLGDYTPPEPPPGEES